MFENTYFDLLIPFLWGKIIGPEQSTDLCFHPANERNLSCIVSLLLSSCSNLALFLLPTWHVNKRSVDSWLATVMINNTAGDTPESSAIFQDLVSILLAPLPSSSPERSISALASPAWTKPSWSVSERRKSPAYLRRSRREGAHLRGWS